MAAKEQKLIYKRCAIEFAEAKSGCWTRSVIAAKGMAATLPAAIAARKAVDAYCGRCLRGTTPCGRVGSR